MDLDCDMPLGFDFGSLEEEARERFRAEYRKFRITYLDKVSLESKPDEPVTHATQRTLQALQFLQEDEKQLVQLRVQGFSFNRLAPYTSLDDYMPQIENAWRKFLDIAKPIQVIGVRLRYVNRILLPLTENHVPLEDYLRIGPRLPDEEAMTFVSFLNQHVAVEVESGYQVTSVLTTQPHPGDMLPIIFDNTVVADECCDPQDWPWIYSKIQSIRGLKNRVFRNTLTEKCLNLFQ